MRWLTAVLVVPALALAIGLTRSSGPDASPVPPGSQHPGAGGAHLSTPSGAHSRPGEAPARAAVGEHRGAAPAQRPTPARFEVTAASSASVQLRLRRVIHPDLQRTTFTSTGSYAGVWILDAHGNVVGSALRLRGGGHRPYTSSPDALAAGTYTVYLIGKGRVAAHIPLRAGEAGLSITATRPTTASYTQTRHTIAPTEGRSTVRLPIPDAPASTGYAGGFMLTSSRA